MKYTIEYQSETIDSFQEKNFCFSCGCFQGGVPSTRN